MNAAFISAVYNPQQLMNVPKVSRILWLTCACVVAIARAASATPGSVVADFDGDGHHDVATLDQPAQSLLRIWLSTTRTVSVVHSATPILGIAAHDLDGDQRAELITGGTRKHLQVWSFKQAGFKRVRTHHRSQPTLTRESGHRLHDRPDGPPSVDWLPAPVIARVLSPLSRAPALTTTRVLLSTSEPHSHRPLTPLASRPPPLSR